MMHFRNESPPTTSLIVHVDTTGHIREHQHHIMKQSPAARSARIERLIRWNSNAKSTALHVTDDAELGELSRFIQGSPQQPIWIAVRLPERDSAGRRTAQADWAPLTALLRQADALPTALRDSQAGRALQSLSNPVPGGPAHHATSLELIRRTHPQYGQFMGIRIVRISTLTLGRAVISARHRDGIIVLRGPAHADAPAAYGWLRGGKDTLNITEWHKQVRARLSDGPETPGALREALEDAVLYQLGRFPAQLEDMLAESETSLAGATMSSQSPGEPANDLSRLQRAWPQIDRVLRGATKSADGRKTVSTYRQIAGELRDVRTEMRTLVDARMTILIGQQLAQTREDQRLARLRTRSEQATLRRLSYLASLIVVPSFVAAAWGANVPLPRQSSVWATWAMLAMMVGVALLATQLVGPMVSPKDTGESELDGELHAGHKPTRMPWKGAIGAVLTVGALALLALPLDRRDDVATTPLSAVGNPTTASFALTFETAKCPCVLVIRSLAARNAEVVGRARHLVPLGATVPFAAPVPRRRRAPVPATACVELTNRGGQIQRNCWSLSKSRNGPPKRSA